MALATFLQLLRPHSLEERRAQRLYEVAVRRVAAQMRKVLDDWLALREMVADYNQLANASAVNRWELMRLAREADELNPPRSIVSLHRDIYNAVVGGARACQLLANGYRSHKSEAVCDGQALLLETVTEINELVAQLQMRL